MTSPTKDRPDHAYLQALYEETVLRNPWICNVIMPDGKPLRPTEKQAEFLYLSDTLEILYGGAAGGGKSGAMLMAALQFALDINTPIPTPSGWKNMGDVKIGDTVFDINGDHTKVIWTTGKLQSKECYDLTFNDGSHIVADADHLWLAHNFVDRLTKKRKAERPLRAVSTREIAATVRTDHAKPTSNWSVPPCSHFKMRKNNNLLINPYVLGAWLGDGSKKNGDIAGIDEEVFEGIFEFYKKGYQNKHHRYALGLSGDLKELGLKNNKHIPDIYLRASYEQRLDLLRGLMDTDGTAEYRYGGCRFFNTDYTIITGFLDLVRGLGFVPRCSRQKYTTITGKHRHGWLVSFIADVSVFRIARKAKRQKLVKHQYRYITDAIPVHGRQVQCLTVASKTRSFLAGETYCPTHNCDMPGYAALIIRRTLADLEKPGALISKSHEWLRDTAAKWYDRKKTWIFPSGATLSFGYLEGPNDRFNYKGAELQMIGIDECTDIEEVDYRYMFSRLRRLKDVEIPIRMRCASNPGGKSHDFFKQRFFVEGKAAGRVFIPAKLKDNPHLDEQEYIKSLDELDPITKAQLLAGDWTVRAAGSMFRREWFHIKDVAPARMAMVRAWDLAASTKKRADYTVGVLMGRDIRTGDVYVLDVRRIKADPQGVNDLILQTANIDGQGVTIYLPQEPGDAGIFLQQSFIRLLAGFPFRFYGESGAGDKATRAQPLASYAGAGKVFLCRGAWISQFLDELEGFGISGHDDVVDASARAFSFLTLYGLSEIPYKQPKPFQPVLRIEERKRLLDHGRGSSQRRRGLFGNR